MKPAKRYLYLVKEDNRFPKLGGFHLLAVALDGFLFRGALLLGKELKETPHVIIGNLLNTRQNEVWLCMNPEKIKHIVTDNKIKIESKIIDELVKIHENMMNLIETYLYHGKIMKNEKEVPDNNFDFERRDSLGDIKQETQCATGCPATCAPSCKPSCCFPQFFSSYLPNTQSPTPTQISPGHLAAGQCSPTCALFWTQNLLDSINGVFQNLPCPNSCRDWMCCQPTQEYISLATSCSSQCAPTYQSTCCQGNQSQKNDFMNQVLRNPPSQQPPTRPEPSTIKYVPCSAF
ncbi:hypothetical protein HZS_2869, partial [Henneguya salminicola]